MSKNMPNGDSRTPEGQLLRVLRGEAELEDFISEGDFVDVMGAARWRLIRVFVTARTGPNKGDTSGYVQGLDDKLTSLASHVQKEMPERAQRKIYCAEDLPPRYQSLDNRRQRRVVEAVRFELFMRLLTLMREEHGLWYMDGAWSMPPSVLDEYRLRVKRAKQSYRDDRCFHGRPRRDRARLRQIRFAGGVSTGV